MFFAKKKKTEHGTILSSEEKLYKKIKQVVLKAFQVTRED